MGTGAIEEDQLFYLMSRGLSRDQATRLSVEGLWEELVAPLSAAVAVIACRTCAAVAPGCLASRMAATPETWGVAMEVPSQAA